MASECVHLMIFSIKFINPAQVFGGSTSISEGLRVTARVVFPTHFPQLFQRSEVITHSQLFFKEYKHLIQFQEHQWQSIHVRSLATLSIHDNGIHAMEGKILPKELVCILSMFPLFTPKAYIETCLPIVWPRYNCLLLHSCVLIPFVETDR